MTDKDLPEEAVKVVEEPENLRENLRKLLEYHVEKKNS